MTELKKAFESLGFKKVAPVLASGNVVFETAKAERIVLEQRIESVLAKQFGVRVVAIVRTADQIFGLIKLNPFRSAKLPPNTKLQVTLLAEPTNIQAKFPIRMPAREFQIVQISSSEICSAVDLSTNARTPELMKVLEKQFGKNITTRTWNTIEKIEKILAAEEKVRHG